MQMATFNLAYAASLPAVAPAAEEITGGETSSYSLSSAQLNDVRSLLTSNDDYDFGSAAWFLTNHCGSDVRSGLQGGSLAGWQTYLTDCVGTTATSDREAYWLRAVQVLGV
jgi:hypothetical protein